LGRRGACRRGVGFAGQSWVIRSDDCCTPILRLPAHWPAQSTLQRGAGAAFSLGLVPDICCRHYAVVTLRQAMAAPRTLAGMPASRMGRAPGRAWAAPAGSDHPDPHPHAIPAAAGCAVPRSRHPLRHRKGIPSASTARIGVAPPRTWASGVAAAHPPSTQERGLHGRIRLPRDRGWGEATRPRHEFVHGRVHRRHNFHLSADARAFHLLIDAAQRAGRSGGDGFSFGSLRAGVAVDGLRRRVSFKTGCSHSASAGEWRPSTPMHRSQLCIGRWARICRAPAHRWFPACRSVPI